MGVKSLAFWVTKAYARDEIFNEQSKLNRDNCLAPFRSLKRQIEYNGGTCHTQDVFREAGLTPNIVLFLDIPAAPVSQLLGNWSDRVRKWVILQECEVIISRNWQTSFHEQFDIIFTWHDRLVDNKKYYKLNFSQDFPESICKNSARTKFCAVIAGNKKSNHPRELYSKRVEAIHWFEDNHPEKFDLYGLKWDKHTLFGMPVGRVLNKISVLQPFLKPVFPSYKGKIASKIPVLEQYKFAICYENAKDIEGYITEKIFDCFFAGCIPIYWGANNVSNHIPKECYIDRLAFGSYEDLYQYLTTMSSKEYQRYLENIDDYLKSSQAFPYTSDYFAYVVAEKLSRE